MAVRSPVLAKLTRPKLYDALPRPRLFNLLDEALTRPIVWICGPPGAGKTALVASYIEMRKRPCLWFQMDVGDTDAGSFVHYMKAAAVQLVGKDAETLPVFTSELQQDLARFARGFFRDLFTILPPRCIAVLDNFHEPRNPAQHRTALAQALEEIPDGMALIAISRADPPAEFARLMASRRIARIEAAALRCTPEEAEQILPAGTLDQELLQKLQAQTDGWVAALVLLREHLSRADSTADEMLGEGKDAIFQYFAGEIFNNTSKARQRILMLSAIPPSITEAEAVELTGDEDAPQALDYLYRRHLFVDRRRGAETSYQYHALFREFLLTEERRRLSKKEQHSASGRAAGLLAKRGQTQDALALYRDAEDWEAIRELIHANALEWARQGRAQVLSEWILALPAPVRAEDPWLEYWFGRAWIYTDPERGRPALERAFEAFRQRADIPGQALALNTIVTGYYYEWADFVPLDRWLPEFEPLLAPERVNELDRGSELRARAAYAIALLFRRPDDPQLDVCAQRLDELIDHEPDLTVRVMAACTLFNYLNWKGKGEWAERFVARIEPMLEQPQVTPLMQLWWRTHAWLWHTTCGRHELAAEVIGAARSIAERYGLETHLFAVNRAQATGLVSNGEYAAARSLLDAMQARMRPGRRMDWAYFHFLKASLEQNTGNLRAAVEQAERAVAIARETSLPALQFPHFLARLAHIRMQAGDVDAGMRTLDEAIALATHGDQQTLMQERKLVGIARAVESGKAAAVGEDLQPILSAMRAKGQLEFLRNRPDFAATLAGFALEQNIESDFVRTLIARNALKAPPGMGSRWPFRIRVSALGHFELELDGELRRVSGQMGSKMSNQVSSKISGKAQQRPLDLLKAIIAFGGRDVDSQRLMAALWPDAEGGAAKTSFDTTLFRLRKLLGVDAALVLAGGKVSLSEDLCWTDVWELEAALSFADAHAARVSAKQVADPTVRAELISAAAGRLLAAYGGELLPGEEHAWLAKPRHALRSRFVRCLLAQGEELERGRNWAAAAHLYRRGLEADNLAEPLYRGLMRSLNASGDYAEALNAFRRCRELLSIVLGLKPSDETESLHREIVASANRTAS